MPKTAKKKLQVAAFIRETLEVCYKEKTNRKITKKNMPEFTSKEALVAYVLKDPNFLDSDKYAQMSKDEQEKVSKNRTIISSNTIRGAINYLLDHALIGVNNGQYVWKPVPTLDERHFPILTVAPQTTITMNVPGDIIFLTVPSGFSNAIADYLSAQFYKDDILFIPMGKFIMCVGVLPKSVVDGKEKKEREGEPSYSQMLCLRIEKMLHKFKVEYPSFTYGFPYEMEYSMHHDNDFQGALYHSAESTSAAQIPENYIDPRTTGEYLTSIQERIALVTELAERAERLGLNGLPSETEETDEDECEGEEYASEEEMKLAVDVFFDDRDEFLELDAEQLREYLAQLEEQLAELDAREPKNEESDEYDDWADEHEDLEYLIDEVKDRLGEIG